MTFAGAKWTMAERRPSWVKSGAPSLDLDLAMGRAWLNGRAYRGEAAIKALFSNFSTPAHYALGLDGKLYAIPANALDCFYMPPGTCRGQLIEEGRTNDVIRSREFSTWTLTNVTAMDNQGIAPDGSLTASLVDDGSTSNISHVVARSVPWVSGTTYTYSIFVKSLSQQWIQITANTAVATSAAYANYDIVNGVLGSVGASASATIVPFSNGWFRLTFTVVSNTSSNATILQYFINNSNSARGESNNGNNKQILFWGAQKEVGIFSTSFIPTADISATRTTPAVGRALGNEYRWPTSTMFSEYQVNQDASLYSTGRANQVSWTGGNSNGIRIDNLSTNSRGLAALTSGTQAAIQAGGGLLAGVNRKAAFAFATDDFRFAVDGVLGTPDTLGNVPDNSNPFTLYLGHGASQSSPLNGYLKRAALYTRGLSNPELQAITAA